LPFFFGTITFRTADSHHGDEVLHALAHQGGDPVPWSDAELSQGGGEPLGILPQAPVAEHGGRPLGLDDRIGHRVSGMPVAEQLREARTWIAVKRRQFVDASVR
jgi:hypothetical protein